MSLSIRQYALLFAAISLLLISGFAYRTYLEFDHTNSNIEQSQQNAALKEIKHNLKNTLSILNDSINELTTWEETHQQLANPAFFPYWYSRRMKHTARNLQQFISDLMIYDINGNALAQLTDNTLPAKIETPVKNNHYVFEKNSLLFTLPVIDTETANKPKGYLTVRVDLIQLLKKQSSYYISPDSIALSKFLPEGPVVEIKPEFIEYEIIKTRELDLLKNQLNKSTTEMIILIILPALVFYGLLVYILSRPINDIHAYLVKLNASPEQHESYESNLFFNVKELQAINESLHTYHSELFDTHAVLDEKNKALWDQAHHDALTGSYNRRAFDEQWSNLNDLLAEHRVNISFILFDVNLFKSINDTHGHQVGDEVLKAIVNCIHRSLRKGEHLFRLGGDEFASFLIDSTTEIALEVAQRCLDAIETFPFENIGMPEPVRVSIGISQASNDDFDSFRDLQWQADAAMYAAKRPGNADIVIYTDEITENSKGLLSSWLSNTVYQAIDKGIGLVMYYQPIIDFNKRKISYYEALVRIHANGELISAASIFNVVEARRFEIELDHAVIRRLTEDLKEGKIPEGTGVSVNLSAPTLTKPSIVEWLQPLKRYAQDYKIVLEVTETALITDLRQVTAHLNELRKLGFTIALDDFGSGYSSVKYLASMPVDVVKFDITLVQCLLDDKQRLMITRLAQMIGEVGHELVAEGIEDKVLLDQVIASGFHYGQGYMFGRPEQTPKKQSEIEAILLENHPSFEQLSLH